MLYLVDKSHHRVSKTLGMTSEELEETSMGEQATPLTVSGNLPWSSCLDRCLEVTAQIILIDFDVGPNSIINY